MIAIQKKTCENRVSYINFGFYRTGFESHNDHFVFVLLIFFLVVEGGLCGGYKAGA